MLTPSGPCRDVSASTARHAFCSASDAFALLPFTPENAATIASMGAGKGEGTPKPPPAALRAPIILIEPYLLASWLDRGEFTNATKKGSGVIDINVAIALVGATVLIAMGATFRHRFIPSPDFWSGLEKLTYFVLLPALLITGLAKADFTTIDPGPIVLVLAASALFSSLLAYATRRLAAGHNGPAFTSVFQGTVRFNTYIGLTTATALFQSDGTAIAALATGVLVPLVNLASTIALAHHGHHKPRGTALVATVFFNPLILACVTGLAVNLIGSVPAVSDVLHAPVPALIVQAVASILGVIGGAALPIGLICVGAGLHGRFFARQSLRPVAAAVLLRFLPVPAATLLLCLALGFNGPAAVVCVVFQSLPTATSSYVFSRRLGGDAPLMAQITAAQTVLAGAVLPAWILIATAVLL